MSVRVLPVMCVLAALFVLTLPISAQSPTSDHRLLLRRVAFDPLRDRPSITRASATEAATSLRIVQFDQPIGKQSIEQLRLAGFEPLAYLPEYAYLVRVKTNQNSTLVRGTRWSGPFLPAYKRAPELDGMLGSPGSLSLTILGTPDAQTATLKAAVLAAGGHVREQSQGAFGPRFVASLPTGAVATLLSRDDVLWIEPWHEAKAFNDQGRAIMQVDAVRQQLPGLTGKGQVVAVADTGLDLKDNVLSGSNPDFAPQRILAAENVCSPEGDWSDRSGHGTHVAGTILGRGAFSGGAFAGIAPEAQLVVQWLPLSKQPDCAFSVSEVMSHAYASGARIQNASWGFPDVKSTYDSTASEVDAFISSHPEHLFVVAAGNSGEDCQPLVNSACGRDGVIDRASINAPATAKNVLSVGATESVRPRFTTTWGDFFASRHIVAAEPIASDNVSDNADGMAAFSSRGPTSDGRLKPEIVAPGVHVVSSASHHPAAYYSDGYYAGAGLNYAYDSGTSMSAPMVSGVAALVRQWLVEARNMPSPSAALLKALLLNGATNIAPGQYGEGASREIPAEWPNNVEGWGRANLASAIGLGDTPLVVDYQEQGGVQTGQVVDFPIQLSAQQTIRATLAWSDPAALPNAAKTLVNDLDLELLDTQGKVVARGNANAELPDQCRVGGADRCNNLEAATFVAPNSGSYTLRVRAVQVAGASNRQPFALVAGSPAPALAPEQVQVRAATGKASASVTWANLPGAQRYEVVVQPQNQPAGSQQKFATADLDIEFVGDIGDYAIQVRGCNPNGCGPWSLGASVRITTAPQKVFAPFLLR